MRIGVLSDTHGFLPQQVYSFFEQCDELWHAGDIGQGVLDALEDFKPVRAVWGNIDDASLHHCLPQTDVFEREGRRVMLTHIGGRPGRYAPGVTERLRLVKPDIFVCGHSHILRVGYDKDMRLLHINPGAAGRQGIHRVCTLVRFVLDPDPSQLEVLDFQR